MPIPPDAWLPPGKKAAVCFTIDDVHPGRSTDAYEAGGDLDRGALGHVQWLLERHSQLHVTLFTTADWREISPMPTRKLLARIPFVRERVMLAPILPVGTMRLDRHPEFISFLKRLPRTEVGLHGLYHVHHGPRIYQEFQAETFEECEAKLKRALNIFRDAGLPAPLGMTPPGWHASPGLLSAIRSVGLRFVGSSRDINTPIDRSAMAAMSGLHGVSLIYPERLPNGLVHFTTNFQATSHWERAKSILDAGGLLAIKAHIAKNCLGYIMIDGVDGLYANFLDLLFSRLEREYGDALWWPSMGQISQRIDAYQVTDGR